MSTAFESARAAFTQGLAHFEARRFDAAETQFRASLAALPGRPSTLCNLGATLLKLGRPAEALAALDEALANEPGNAETLSHRALALAELGRDDAALAALDQVLAAQNTHATAWLHRGLCLARLQRPQEALQSFSTALQQQPTLAEAWAHRGALNKDMGHEEAARTDLQRALELGAEPRVNGFLLASLGGGKTPAVAPAVYVRQLFDGYAEGFDAHLVGALEYRVHEELPQALATRGLHFSSALDLGCGTGLCGPHLRPLTTRLHGIDLSPGMLKQAHARGVYDELLQGEIVAYMQATPQRYGLVLAADVFIYLGDLQPVFAGVQRVLQPGGWFCFSVEQAANTEDFELRASSRYAHSARYLRALAALHGFDEVEMRLSMLRLHQGVPLAGLLVSLKRGAALNAVTSAP